MAENIVAQVDPAVVSRAASVLQSMGLSVSDAVRMLLTFVAREETLPFMPNADTVTAMAEARRGENMQSFASLGALMQELHADD